MATEQTVLAIIRAARPSFRSRHDKVAYAVHAAFVAAGFVLHATGPEAFADDVLSSSSTDEVGTDNWNEVEDNYAFVYSKSEKGSKKVLMKCIVMNNNLIIDVLRDGDSEPQHLELDVTDYVEDNAAGTNYSSMFKNLGKLVANVNKEILGKLDGSSLAASSSGQPSSSERIVDPYYPEDDPYVNPPHTGGYIVPPIPGSGYNDLLPGPGAGMYPQRGDFPGGSMFVGPNDPRFFGGGGIRDPGFPGGQPGGVPPGARYDPLGPPGLPGFGPDQFGRDPRRPGGGRHPDLQRFPDGSDFI